MDLTKYKRVFTFGCSFTQYVFPTWADILFEEMPHAEHYNFGRRGAGNLYISNAIARANIKYSFCETDLVVVLYTSPLREDRWVDGDWQAWGNVYNQPFYDKNFVKNYCDPIGILLRDLGIVEVTRGYVASLPCETVQLMSINIEDDMHGCDVDDDFKDTVANLYNSFKSTMDYFPAARLHDRPINGFMRYDQLMKKFIRDGHPTPLEYFQFMQDVGLPVTDIGLKYATDATAFVLSEKKDDEIIERFPELLSRQNKFFDGLPT